MSRYAQITKAEGPGPLRGGGGWVRSWDVSLGANLITNPGLEGVYVNGGTNIDIAPNWISACTDGQDEAYKETTIVHEELASQHIVASVAGRGIITNAISPTLGIWYQYQIYIKRVTGSVRFRGDAATGTPDVNITSGADWQRVVITGRCINAVASFSFITAVSGAAEWYLDTAYIKSITLASMLNGQYTTAAGNCDITTAVRCDALGQNPVGFACNLDSKTNPQNGVFVYITKTKMYVDKLVGGTWTTVLAGTAITYVDDAKIRIRKNGTTYQVFYNGAQIGGDQTIADAGIIDNTLHCQFSSFSGNQFTAAPIVVNFP